MAPSYRDVDYSVRVGKNIERKMIFDALLRLDRIRPLAAYTYIGFGGIFFTDFLLAHRYLGLTSLISVEEQASNVERFLFNRPLACIDVRPGHSGQILPGLDWSSPAIIWLDYDGTIDGDSIADIEHVISAATPGSVLLVTLNVQPPKIEQDGDRVVWLKRLLEHRLPASVTKDAQLDGGKLGDVSRRVMLDAVELALTDRNGPLPTDQKLRFRQIFHFRYADGAQMMTIGGVLHRDDEAHAVDDAFSDLPQLRLGVAPLSLRTPVLTPREILHLTAQLPGSDPAESPGLPNADVEAFSQLYRYYPSYRDIAL